MTAPVIEIVDSDEPGMILIEQTESSGVIARSWASDAIPVAARLNPDAPPALDARTGSPTHGQTIAWRMPSAATWRAMGAGSEEQRQAFRRAMIAAGRDCSREI